jgi:hypothetical protein
LIFRHTLVHPGEDLCVAVGEEFLNVLLEPLGLIESYELLWGKTGEVGAA